MQKLSNYSPEQLTLSFGDESYDGYSEGTTGTVIRTNNNNNNNKQKRENKMIDCFVCKLKENGKELVSANFSGKTLFYHKYHSLDSLAKVLKAEHNFFYHTATDSTPNYKKHSVKGDGNSSLSSLMKTFAECKEANRKAREKAV